MILGIPLHEAILLLAGLLAASALAGVLSGLLGVGGGIVLVPVLFWLFTLTEVEDDVAMHMAVASSLATIIATSVVSARAHRKKDGIDAAILWRWGPAVAFGALASGLAARFIDGDVLRAVFGIVAVLVAINMATPKSLVLRAEMPASRTVNAAIACVIGAFSALMGIGGGSLAVPTMVAFSVPIRRAVGTASMLGLFIAVPATAGFVLSGLGVADRLPFSVGYVNLVAVALILPLTTALAPFGAGLAHSLDPRIVKRFFAVFLGITAIKMLT
ncbi:sulfite exporter TauE/SafE family protein [Falsirhodobacter xinxiangensis]|uniref:sulfite exporter TauE/SafE family protein n=1 Tax=Falsirhodobacter xinxiangensis TaxID=2530049 RepID=UPI0010AABC16|nr:sulfite exporter TauE/SafE family protein [Rhodobacter xinxiangensis]